MKKISFAGGYTFSDIDRAGPLTKSFMKFIRSCDKYGRKATRRGFYKIIKKEWAPGNNCTFFSAIRQAGIVMMLKDWNGKYTECTYIKGPNWNDYVKGEFNNENKTK